MDKTSNTSWRQTLQLSVLIGIAVILSARALWLFLSDPIRFPIHTIRFDSPSQHISRYRLQTVLQAYSGQSFFSISLNRLRKDFYQIPRIQSVVIEREWPDTLVIHLEEKVPFAHWNQMLIDTNGDIFPVEENEQLQQLPRLQGPEEKAHNVLYTYKTLHKILSDYGLSASIVHLRANEAWELTLRDGVHIRLDREQIKDKLLRFSKVYASLQSEKKAVPKSVDLRYPRGMAVEWNS